MQVVWLEVTSGGPVVQSLWGGLTAYFDQVVQGLSQLSFESKDGNSSTSLGTCSSPESPSWIFFFIPCENFCAATCDYFSFFFRCAFLRKVWLHLIYSYSLDSWSEKLDPQLAFSSPGWTYLASSASSSSASFYFHSQMAAWQYIYSFSDMIMCMYIFFFFLFFSFS